MTQEVPLGGKVSLVPCPREGPLRSAQGDRRSGPCEPKSQRKGRRQRPQAAVRRQRRTKQWATSSTATTTNSSFACMPPAAGSARKAISMPPCWMPRTSPAGHHFVPVLRVQRGDGQHSDDGALRHLGAGGGCGGKGTTRQQCFPTSGWTPAVICRRTQYGCSPGERGGVANGAFHHSHATGGLG